jgi:hypothetical protein
LACNLWFPFLIISKGVRGMDEDKALRGIKIMFNKWWMLCEEVGGSGEWWWGCEILVDRELDISWRFKVRWKGYCIMKKWAFKYAQPRNIVGMEVEASRVGGDGCSREGSKSSSTQRQMEEEVQKISVKP